MFDLSDLRVIKFKVAIASTEKISIVLHHLE